MNYANAKHQTDTNTVDLVFFTSVDLGALSGPAIHVLNLVNALAARSLRVVLIAPKVDGAMALELDPRVERVSCINTRRFRLPGSLCFLFVLPYVSKYRTARVMYVRSAPFSVLVCQWARWTCKAPLFVEFNGWLSDEADLLGGSTIISRIVAWGQKRESKIADGVRAVTARLADLAVGAGADPSGVSNIPTGTNLEVFRPQDRDACRTELGIKLDRDLAVFVGNLWPAIDLATAIEALLALASDGRCIDLVVVGDGPARNDMQTRAAVLKDVGANVHFTGSLPPARAAKYLGAADIALAPFSKARNEAIGLSPLKVRDYAAAGRLTITSNLPGLADFNDEPWFFSAEPENPEAYAQAINAALATDRLPAEERARSFAEAHFGWDSVARQMSKMVGLDV